MMTISGRALDGSGAGGAIIAAAERTETNSWEGKIHSVAESIILILSREIFDLRLISTQINFNWDLKTNGS